jgi:hypothetical protein
VEKTVLKEIVLKSTPYGTPGPRQWQCKDTKEERRKGNMTTEVWEKEEEGAKMLVKNLKTSDYNTDYRHQDPNRNEKRTNEETTKETANGQGKL